LAWSPDGDYLAGGTEGGEVVVWETVNWTQHRILKAGSTVNSLEFTGNTGMLIAAGNKKNTAEEKAWNRHGFVKAWDISKDWEVIFDIPAQKESSKSVRLSPDEKTFAVAGFANQVKIFSFPEGNEIKSMETNHKIEAIAFHPEGNFLFAGGHGENVLVYRTGDYDLIMEYPCKRVEYIDFSSDGRLMITGHEDSGFIKLHLFMTSLESPGAYQKLSKEILNNKDLD
jgi:WD40 repeat protein